MTVEHLTPFQEIRPYSQKILFLLYLFCLDEWIMMRWYRGRLLPGHNALHFAIETEWGTPRNDETTWNHLKSPKAQKFNTAELAFSLVPTRSNSFTQNPLIKCRIHFILHEINESERCLNFLTQTKPFSVKVWLQTYKIEICTAVGKVVDRIKFYGIIEKFLSN